MMKRKLIVIRSKMIVGLSCLGVGVCMVVVGMGHIGVPRGAIGQPLSLSEQRGIRGGACYVYATNDCPNPMVSVCPVGATEEGNCPDSVNRKVIPHTDYFKSAGGLRGWDHASPAEIDFCWRIHTCVWNEELEICVNGVDTDLTLPQTDYLLDGNPCNIE